MNAEMASALYAYSGLEDALRMGKLAVDGPAFAAKETIAVARIFRIQDAVKTTVLVAGGDPMPDLANIIDDQTRRTIDGFRFREPTELDAGNFVVKFSKEENRWHISVRDWSSSLDLPVKGAGVLARIKTINIVQGHNPDDATVNPY